MSDQSNEKDVQYEAPEPPVEPSEAKIETSVKRSRRGEGNWIFGVILIVLGAVFLLQNQGIFSLQNWWALFILIPALSSLRDGWVAYQESGYFNGKARNSLFWGFILVVVSAILLLNLGWTYLGPGILILIGLAILVNAMLPRERV